MRHECLFAGCLFILAARLTGANPCFLFLIRAWPKDMLPRVAQAGFTSLMSAMDIFFGYCSHSFRDKSLSTEHQTISNCKFVPDAEVSSDEGW